jgi:TldD protein
MRDLALRALDTARSRGADYADVRVLRQASESVTVRLQNVESLTYDESLGFGVRVLVAGYWGFASSHKMTMEEADRVAAEAVRIARASATVRGQAANIGPRPRSRTPTPRR